jgi:uncharacterized membrane protein YgcG
MTSLAGIALAADPPVLAGTITDQTGRLDGGHEQIEAAAKALLDETGITAYVLFTDAIDGEDPGAFVERVAADNNLLDGKNALLMVSMSDRKDALWSSGDTAVTGDELTSIRTGTVEPNLKGGDFVAAMVQGIEGIKAAETTVAPVVTPPPAQQPQEPAKPMDLSWVGWFLVGGFLLVAGLFAFYFVADFLRQRAARQAEERAARDAFEKLSKEARGLLISTDEKVRSAEQELAFAEAEFGAEEVGGFRASLDVAKSEMQKAFQTGQAIDDDVPESFDDRQTMLAEIVARTGKVNEAMDQQVKAVQKLRDLEANAAATCERLIAAKKDRDDAVVATEMVLDRLLVNGASVAAGIDSNVEAGMSLFDVANKKLAEAQKAIDGGLMAKAALAVRTAEEAIAKGQANLDAVNAFGEQLDDAETNLDSEIHSAAAEIDKAEAAIKTNNVAGLSYKVEQAKEALAAAKKESTAVPADLIVAYTLAQKANELADSALDGVRDEVDKRRRALETAKQQIRQAEISLKQADTYIASNGNYVGRKARNRLSEAQRAYQDVTGAGESNIFNAATAAVLVSQYANDSYSIARNDVAEATAPPPTPSYSGGGYSRSSSSSGSHSSSSSGSFGSSSNDSFGSFGGFSSGGSFGGGGGGGGGSSSGGGW